MEFHKNSIKLDDGTNKKRQPIKDEDGKDLKFISLIGALNYMSLQGRELFVFKEDVDIVTTIVDDRLSTELMSELCCEIVNKNQKR